MNVRNYSGVIGKFSIKKIDGGSVSDRKIEFLFTLVRTLDKMNISRPIIKIFYFPIQNAPNDFFLPILPTFLFLPAHENAILDTEANKFYDRNHQLYDAALLTRCYTQHALRPFIDSEINHKRHFIKIPFINKGIEFIDLPSIFKDRSVTSSIPAYFQNSEPPIICYKYNKPIRNTVFNFNKLVSELDIHANTPES